MNSDEFLALVNLVLVEAGRSALDVDGPERRIIRVEDDDRVLQMLAGPGSGKTEMLVWRVLHELNVRGTNSRRVMVTTFTRRAATELSVRIVERSDALLRFAHASGIPAVDPRVHDLRIGTIHALCDELLAEFDPDYMAAGLQLIDEFEVSTRIARQFRFWLFGFRPADSIGQDVLGLEPVVGLLRAPWESTWWPASMPDRVDCLKRLIAHQTETWGPRCATTGRLNGIELVHALPGLTTNLAELQRRWENYLNGQSILDFTTIQKRFYENQARVRNHLDHVFVDEFQDTNPIQFAIHFGWLARPETRLTVVGDDDQSVYRFRGSDIECFAGLEAACASNGAAYRIEKLERNHRSTRSIVRFTEAFRAATVLSAVSMPKTISAPSSAADGAAPRLLEGGWPELAARVANEIASHRATADATTPPPTSAVLMFSTSERRGRGADSPGMSMRAALETAGLRVYNPQNKTAATASSPVYQLFALISYLIDPVSRAPVGVGGREIEVWATAYEAVKVAAARTEPPGYGMRDDHAAIQKGFLKRGGGQIGAPTAEIAPLVAYVDAIRDRLLITPDRRLTLAGFVARLLALPFFRDVGFSRELFREALFTALLESSIAASRRTNASLDTPLAPSLGTSGKVIWPPEMWSFLSIFGPLVASTRFDDPEVEAFQDGATLLLTFHQAKGLEFDHVYVGMAGRGIQPSSVLLTMLFSGEQRAYTLDGGRLETTDADVNRLALADREREVYVALSRPKQTLTILHDPGATYPTMAVNAGLQSLFDGIPGVPLSHGVTEYTWR